MLNFAKHKFINGVKMIITIDGPAAAGKGTLAGILAKTYNLAYFDTGMLGCIWKDCEGVCVLH